MVWYIRYIALAYYYYLQRTSSALASSETSSGRGRPKVVKSSGIRVAALIAIYMS